eukprot:27543-Chlamydomonas_euryale.AAC.13
MLGLGHQGQKRADLLGVGLLLLHTRHMLCARQGRRVGGRMLGPGAPGAEEMAVLSLSTGRTRPGFGQGKGWANRTTPRCTGRRRDGQSRAAPRCGCVFGRNSACSMAVAMLAHGGTHVHRHGVEPPNGNRRAASASTSGRQQERAGVRVRISLLRMRGGWRHRSLPVLQQQAAGLCSRHDTLTTRSTHRHVDVVCALKLVGG